MNPMKITQNLGLTKLFLSSVSGLLFFVLTSQGGVQDGRVIPDKIIIMNDTDQTVNFDGKEYSTGQDISTINDAPRDQNRRRAPLQIGEEKYIVTYPTYKKDGGQTLESYHGIGSLSLKDLIAGRITRRHTGIGIRPLSDYIK
jgi:hypothetical protein